MIRWFERPAGWLYDRLGLRSLVDFAREHRVPPEIAGRWGWAYVFGSATLTALIVQVLTGIALTTAYVPTPDSAYDSLIYMTHETRWGWYIRALHYLGASAMVVFVCLHMIRIALTASYKFPREMQWISGVFLFVLILAMAWTGQLLRWNEDGFWTVVVGARFAERVPLIGDWLAWQVLAGDHVGGSTLTRFYSLHTLIFPLTLGAFLAVHLYLVLYNGISELPDVRRPVDPNTYREWYQHLKETVGARYIPDTIWREAVVSMALVTLLLVSAWFLGARPLGNPPDPTALHVDPRPDWFVIWYYALLWVKPRQADDLFMVYLPLLVLLGLLLLPLLFPAGPRHPSQRPWAIVGVFAAVITFGWLSALGAYAPWVPEVNAIPLGPAQLGEVDAQTARGARLFAERGCQYCHTVLGEGGSYGPDLSAVATRLSPEEIAVRTVLGIRDMPSYHEILSGPELDDLVRFLVELERR